MLSSVCRSWKRSARTCCRRCATSVSSTSVTLPSTVKTCPKFTIGSGLKVRQDDRIYKINRMNVLVLNCGSSSVKFQLIATDLERIEQDADKRLAHGLIERVGGAGIITLTSEGKPPKLFAEPVRDTRAAVEMILRWAIGEESGLAGVTTIGDIHAVGHRVVHGGEQFTSSALITDEVCGGIEDCIELAPLHNPANIQGLLAARATLGSAIQIGR